MKNVNLSGIDKALMVNGSLKIENKNNLIEANLTCRWGNEVLGKISSSGKDLSQALSKLESVITKKGLSENTINYLKQLKGIDWLLKRDFYLYITTEGEHIGARVCADDQYLYLTGGMYSTKTLKQNGVTDLLEYCNGWSTTLKSHFERNKEDELEG